MIQKNVLILVVFCLNANLSSGQTANQWILNSKIILDFNQSPPRMVYLPESISNSFSPAYFHTLESKRNGDLKNFSMSRKVDGRSDYSFWNDSFNQLNFTTENSFFRIERYPNPLGTRPEYCLGQNNNFYYHIGYSLSSQTLNQLGLMRLKDTNSNVNVNVVDSNNTYNISQFIFKKDSGFYRIFFFYDKPSQLEIVTYNKKGVITKSQSYTFNGVYQEQWVQIVPANRNSAFVLVYGDRKGIKKATYGIHYSINIRDSLILLKEFEVNRVDTQRQFRVNDGCFSPNDSVFFLCHTSNGINNSSLSKINLFVDEKTTIINTPDSSEIKSMALTPNGKLYFEHVYFWSSMQKKALGKIHFPEKNQQNYEIEYSNLVDENASFEIPSFLINPAIGQNVLKMKCLQKNCTDSFIQCYNYSDTLYKTFGWVLMDLDSNVISENSTKTTKFYPPKTGSYLVRLSGKTRFGRNAYRWDKVFFRKPPSIKHNVVADTLCRFSKLPLSATFQSDTTYESSIIWRIKSPLKEDEFNKWRINYMFADTGFYTFQLNYNTGYCTDSLSFNKVFYVVNAPEPGFKINRDTICTSTEISVIDKSNGVATNVTYHWSDGKVFTNREGHNRVFEKAGFYKLVQSLEASNKCVSKDSIKIRVKKGLTTDSLPQLKYATVTDSSMIELQWETIDGIEGYIVKRMNDELDRKFSSHEYSLLDTFNATISPVAYRLLAIDSCMNLSGQSNLAQTILLTTKNQNNEQIELSWNEYEEWQNGVSEYLVQRSNDGINWNNIAGLESRTFQDNTILLSNADSVFYRVIAKKSGDASTSSVSNVRNVNLLSTAFIPNAFSPNADGLNDTFCIGSFGIKGFKCIIFSNTGQVVCVSENPNNIWDGYSSIGEPYPTDTYFYFITYTTSKGETIELKGNLDLIKN